MTKCRLGHLYLLAAVAKAAPGVSGICRLCSCDVLEDLEHFLMDCPMLAPARLALARALQPLALLGDAGRLLRASFGGSRQETLGFLLGDVSIPYVPELDPTDDELTRIRIAKASWLADKCLKNFLVAAWRLRESVLGKVSVAGGHLVTEPSKFSFVDLCRRQADFVAPEMDWVGTRPFWSCWLPVKASYFSRGVGGCKRAVSPFYVVFVGRRVGVFYQWRDVASSVLGCSDAVFKGFSSLHEAELSFFVSQTSGRVGVV